MTEHDRTLRALLLQLLLVRARAGDMGDRLGPVLRFQLGYLAFLRGDVVPIITKRNTAVAAGASINPLVGDQYEFLPFPAQVEFAILTDAITTVAPVATVYSGSDLLQQEGPIPVKTTAPSYPDDFLLSDVAAAGDRLNVQIRNADSAARIFTTVVRITPL